MALDAIIQIRKILDSSVTLKKLADPKKSATGEAMKGLTSGTASRSSGDSSSAARLIQGGKSLDATVSRTKGLSSSQLGEKIHRFIRARSHLNGVIRSKPYVPHKIQGGAPNITLAQLFQQKRIPHKATAPKLTELHPDTARREFKPDPLQAHEVRVAKDRPRFEVLSPEAQRARLKELHQEVERLRSQTKPPSKV